MYEGFIAEEPFDESVLNPKPSDLLYTRTTVSVHDTRSLLCSRRSLFFHLRYVRSPHVCQRRARFSTTNGRTTVRAALVVRGKPISFVRESSVDGPLSRFKAIARFDLTPPTRVRVTGSRQWRQSLQARIQIGLRGCDRSEDSIEETNSTSENKRNPSPVHVSHAFGDVYVHTGPSLKVDRAATRSFRCLATRT